MRRWLAATLLLACGTASAHGPAPAGLGMLSPGGAFAGGFAGDDARPDVMRTNLGLALARPDGTYAYGCPSQWGGAEQGFGAAAPDRSLLVMMGKGAVHASTDAGCSYQPVALPPGLGYAAEAVFSRGRVWLVTRSAAGGALLSVGPALDVREDMRWDAERNEAWTPDTLFTVDEAAGGLYVVGARPTGAVWWRPEGGTFRKLGGLPDEPRLERLDLAEVVGGELWLIATLPEGRQLWRARHVGDTLEVARDEAAHPVIHGPVVFDGRLLAAFGDEVVTAQPLGAGPVKASGVWTTAGAQKWKCLQRFGARVYACTLPAMLLVEAVAPGAIETRPVWRLAQLGGPPAGCPPDAAERTQCELDWLHFGGEIGLTEREPLKTPEDPPLAPTRDEGCAGGRGQGGWLTLAALVAVSRGWRRRGPRAA